MSNNLLYKNKTYHKKYDELFYIFTLVLETEAIKKAEIIKTEATAQALTIISHKKISTYPNIYKVLQFILVQNYSYTGVIIGNIESNKAMFIDHRNIVSILEGIYSIVED